MKEYEIIKLYQYRNEQAIAETEKNMVHIVRR